MSASIYDHWDYRTYLLDFLSHLPNRGYGFKGKMARAIGCQNSYLSRVLAGNADLSVEQAEALNGLLGHSDEETHYFLLIVQHTKAGTPSLKNYFKKQIDRIHRTRLTISGRIETKIPLDETTQLTYFSHWSYCAIHVLSSIPQFQSREAIAQHLELPLKKVASILDFLENCGFVTSEKGRYCVGNRRIHLGTDSPLISRHHSNWRIQGLRSLERDSSIDAHYTSVVSVSLADFDEIKSLFLDAIEKSNLIIKNSNDDMAACIGLDLFQI